MKYTVNYNNLLFNIILDSMKTENRRTIAEKDILNLEKEITKIKSNLSLQG